MPQLLNTRSLASPLSPPTNLLSVAPSNFATLLTSFATSTLRDASDTVKPAVTFLSSSFSNAESMSANITPIWFPNLTVEEPVYVTVYVPSFSISVTPFAGTVFPRVFTDQSLEFNPRNALIDLAPVFANTSATPATLKVIDAFFTSIPSSSLGSYLPQLLNTNKRASPESPPTNLDSTALSKDVTSFIKAGALS